jgi:RNA polymerase sigma factor (sigma-70 family)
MTVPAYRAGPAPPPDPGGHDPREAVDDLFRQHADGLVRFALMLVGDQATAEDVVQEAFLGLYRAWDRVRDPDAVLGYLRTAVVNGARSVHRRRGRARLLRVPHDQPVWSAEAAAMDSEDRRAVLAASVVLPRLLAGSSPDSGDRGSGHYPRFQVVVTYKSNASASLQVESAATGHVVTTVAPPWHGAVWGTVATAGDTGRFIVSAAPKFTGSLSMPTRLYSLTLSARGTVARLTPLPVPVLQGQVTSLAASADGRTVAYPLVPVDSRVVHEVGIITGRTTRHWTIGGLTRTGAGNLSLFDISVSADGHMVAFVTQDQVVGETVWVLSTGSAPGAITARARRVLEFRSIYSPGEVRWLHSALISPDGRTLYLATSANSASGKVVTTLTAYPTAGGASPRTVTTFDVSFNEVMGEKLTPAGGGLLLAWNNYAPTTGYLINPATRTRTTVPLHGLPRLRFTTTTPKLTDVELAW